jgi:hypothetical protein
MNALVSPTESAVRPYLTPSQVTYSALGSGGTDMDTRGTRRSTSVAVAGRNPQRNRKKRKFLHRYIELCITIGKPMTKLIRFRAADGGIVAINARFLQHVEPIREQTDRTRLWLVLGSLGLTAIEVWGTVEEVCDLVDLVLVHD